MSQQTIEKTTQIVSKEDALTMLIEQVSTITDLKGKELAEYLQKRLSQMTELDSNPVDFSRSLSMGFINDLEDAETTTQSSSKEG